MSIEITTICLVNIIALFIVHKLYLNRIKTISDNFEKHRNNLNETTLKDFELWKEVFKNQEVPKIKKDVLARSRNTIRGIATEHLAPLIQKEYNAKDFRHLGDPVDYIIFDGLSDVLDRKSNEIVNVVLLDVKTGNARLNKVQRRIRDAIQEGKIKFEVYNPDKQKSTE